MTTVGSETMSPSLLRSVLTDGAFNVPNHNTKIFKDECMYCFHNPFFTGDFTSIRFITMIPIGMETNSGEPKGKITRLAIGVNSGFDNQKYEVKDTYHITAYPNLDRRSEIVQDLGEDLYHVCQLVINSTSAERLELLQNASNAWDGEKVELNDWKCEADGCGLTENLWLNLTDGSIRCGRSQFVAEGEISKGNNHMKQYYDATGFPLVVKLGTISMEGTADVYSYDEDDAVIDPNLDKHLAHFGIDPCRLKKTEKSTLEMELDMNQKLSLENFLFYSVAIMLWLVILKLLYGEVRLLRDTTV
uniref:UBP-type domain-containing protein n=1 Tax=Heterorhabditis bacteriophora TaxID=37862 RepID=A0A1I7WP15_HETBA